ncbi:ribosome maturation protein RimP [Rhizorhapis sp. SPR117]|uniref:ribosome maturation protein RimP n=1 Tax=Rhizorhapis sp. SPR117 TaxID=2912611 RepID=UPI001F1C5376|nr:ribosome maturation protein RimP [Rhizorhapis sp. SPR117]
MADIATLTQLIEPEAKALGFSLVRVKLFGGDDDRTLQIMAERPETRQLNIADCAALSRRISELFDEVDPIEEAYRLEVSSPGIDRPLTRLSDFSDWAGHEARISLIEPQDGRKQFTGTLKGAEGDVIALSDRKIGDLTIAFANIQSAKLMLTDALITATMPLSTEGADDIQTEG